MSTVLLLSTADTDLLAARASGAGYRIANPTRVDVVEDLPALLDGADIAVVRLLGGRRAWEDGLAALTASGIPTVLLGGETVPDAELMAESSVPAGVVAEALTYLVEGGPANLAELARFLSDTVLLTGEGFERPRPMPAYGVHGSYEIRDDRPTVGVLFYRAHELSGNTAFVDTLCDAIEERGANALPVYCGSLRGAEAGLYDLLGRADALVTTVLAAGGTHASQASAGGDEESWDVGALAELDVPVLQGLCLTTPRAAWEESDAALSPMDAAMQVAIPEFDGRLITVPFSFKEEGPDGVPVYVADPERAARVAGIAVRHARLRHTPNAEKKIALIFTAYPTKHSRVGNAVGLDTPASAVRVLDALRDAGYTLTDHPSTGDELIHRLIQAGGHDVEWLTEEQLRTAPARVPLADYRAWFEQLDPELREAMTEAWGEPPGSLYVDGDDIVLASLRFGNVVVMIQPPRGFGENPVAIYHDPDMPPSHHYLAAYRWLEHSFGADAIVHMGKHGTMEWLPGKGLGMSRGCAPDAVLGDLPLVYPFIVNDPGEGTQAKRRGHATVVDHLVPPMARADTYGLLAELEQLLDEYALVSDLDPAKAPAVRARIWTLVKAAELHHDLHVDAQPDDDEFDEFVLHIDGYLCEIKDVQIRDGLHVLGGGPVGAPRVNLVLAVLRASQVWGGRANALPGLRASLAAHFGLDEKELLAEPGAPVEVPAELTDLVDGPARTASDAIDLLEQLCRRIAEGMEERNWATDAAPGLVREVLGADLPDAVAVLRFACEEVVPRLARTEDEIGHILHALDGGYVPAGPSGSPTRGLVNVLPTGRNFYSVDPKAIPSRLSWEVGQSLADSLVQRYLADTGTYPKSVGLTVWGTSAMRTQGDDIAEILALLGCRPVWDDASRRVTGFEIVPLKELGRPRIDVTVRISGFFRDAFPHVVGLIDDAVRAVADLDEPAESNYVRAHVEEDVAGHGDRRRATSRIFGSKPGAYGAGLLPLIDARNWRSDADLAEVYAVWGGYAYGRGLDGRPARGDMETAFRRIAVAAKNVDTREHDIADADDYFQYHGGMVAVVRHLTGADPEAYVGDSAVPDQVRTRTLGEETHRVFRARVVNPRWMAAMRRHGYKGAFEMAATVDYLFGYDATAGVVDDWMYEKLSAAYVFDPENRDFMRTSNPWALRGITERLLEAADRGLWAAPDQETLDRLRATYLELEGDLEGDA
ncbi:MULTISPECIES: cobaltochelatase subunit CobN [Streptomyces]|uniref:Cobaltochelatase subunit CobN n=1 Tax=Streptomyces thermoviolaceus subsp. thermoviolaceus TaxID=66860 RepID=A0ABX0YP78_STRTL|nr:MULTISPECIES: cobaltochelatase subunit CobN [Streptomyces]MCM3266232.1 cobaltochelatase subunit CobN [Streptomyces thermoviolaceus]NJP14366.1 cobaltochelatase subunit CobN [Streptomyces thermoviolaceus subsp. thermoviolaceus]RSR96969.1 cobaltochelatase subunit CobN [Streptomyces sp. WAC00469]WTD49756.1 cobaltochelatase subunit CobN [Streptomyces thermoviolaceus]GGV81395.1 cobaltochelatase subunit CobN [Streptomyces thermoviolaceus subsp. apingens]